MKILAYVLPQNSHSKIWPVVPASSTIHQQQEWMVMQENRCDFAKIGGINPQVSLPFMAKEEDVSWAGLAGWEAFGLHGDGGSHITT